MQYPRVYHSDVLSINKIVSLCDNAVRHIGTVLRLSLDDKIILFNGGGKEYLAEISHIQKKHISVNIIEARAINRESFLSLHLGQAVARSEKMDWVIQKVVELGVSEITPLITQYTAVKVLPQKLEHWKKIIISACEQCGRNIIPVLHPPIALSQWFLKTDISCGLILDPYDADIPLAQVEVAENIPVYLLIGPEGGFSRDEIALSKQYHFQSVKLGHRILRTETAAVAAVSIVQTLFGDFH